MKFDDKTISKFNLRTIIVDGEDWHYMPITEEKLWDIVKFFRELDCDVAIWILHGSAILDIDDYKIDVPSHILFNMDYQGVVIKKLKELVEMMLEYYSDHQTFFVPVTPENMAGIVELLMQLDDVYDQLDDIYLARQGKTIADKKYTTGFAILYKESDVEFEEVLVLNDRCDEYVISDHYLVFTPEGFYTTTFKIAKEVLNIEERFCKQEGFARVLANTIRNNVYDFRENYKFIGMGMPENV